MRRRLGFIFIIALFLLAAGTGFALAGDGNGDGSGGGQKNPLVIESSFPADGAANVADLESIKVVFSKNIAYMTIRDNNKKCVSLWSGNENIPCEIIIADDQIEREKRNDIIIKPLQPFEKGKTYRVEFAPELESKSGVTLGEKATITFTMAGESSAPQKEEPVLKETPDAADSTADQEEKDAAAAVEDEDSAQETDDTAVDALAEVESTSEAEEPASSDADEDGAGSSQPQRNWLWAGLILVALIAGGVIYSKTSKK